jgi:hypothetical protein
MIIAGLALALAGGGCAVLIFSEFDASTSGGGPYVPFLLIALALLGGGIAMIWLAVKLLRGGSGK